MLTTESMVIKTHLKLIRDYNSEANTILDDLKTDINRLNNNFILSYNYLRRPINNVNDEVFDFINLIGLTSSPVLVIGLYCITKSL